jgi:hypothetical protein
VRRGHLSGEFELALLWQGRGLIGAQPQTDRQRLCFCAFRKRLRRSGLYKATAQRVYGFTACVQIQEPELRP